VIGCNSKLFFHKLRAKRSPLLTKLCLRRPDIVAIDTLRTELGGRGCCQVLTTALRVRH